MFPMKIDLNNVTVLYTAPHKVFPICCGLCPESVEMYFQLRFMVCFYHVKF